MKRIFSFILIFVAVFAVASCGDKKKKDDVKEKVSKEIVADKGGTVSTSDESVAVDIPADALDSNTTITVSVYESSHYSTAKGEKVISTVVEFEPSGTVFKKPIIIKMTANNEIKNSVVAAAVYNEAKGAWSYSEHSEYAILAGKDAAGDPIMQTAAGDPIMLNAAGDPIMTNAAGDPIMMAAAGDPIMLASAGDPIMTNAAGDPIMNAAAGDPIMMTTGHFTAYTFIEIVEESDSQTDSDTDSGDANDTVPDEDADEPEYVPECGNGILDEGEECDNGAGNNNELRGPEAACRKDCTLVRCGDAIVDEGEECDDGSDNGKTDCAYGEKSCELCTTECKKQAGIVAYCGDGVKQDNEKCDDGNTANGDYCSADCQAITGSCGDGTKQSNEVCDDGNVTNGDYCSADCQTVTGSCGDGTKQDNEACDDGNTANGDYCSADCQMIAGSCGDGTKQNNEACDDGNITNGDYCSADCQTVTGSCGDGTKQSNEACDDGNTANGDYCSADCQAITGTCGDGTKQSNEACDDGNTANGDYCSADCQAITGSCGDDTKQDNEKCDDGNTEDGDYCSADCQAITGSCGDEVKQSNEACDDGNTADDDYCSADCQTVTGSCGDGTKQNNEACDDGNTDGGDYCSADCQIATFSCGTLPDNAQWVSGGTYEATWDGTAYSTSATAHYAEEGDCAYQCKATYSWIDLSCTCTDAQHVEDGVCTSNTGEAKNCTNLPANAAWKTSTYTPHWSNGAWSTEPAAVYFEDGGSECTFECVSNFHYEDGSCQSDTKEPASCGTLPANAQWVNGDTYVPTWYGEGYTSASANYAEEGDCAYQCKSTYTWIETNGTCACTAEQHVEDGICKSNTGEAQNCTSLPENAAWAAATYTPHWNGEEWTGEPEATYYEEEGEECTYECVSNFHYEDGSCQSDTKEPASCGTLPENAQWVNGDTYVPTWYGEGYTSASANYAEEGDCAYQCKSTYTWIETNGTCACTAEQHVEDGICKSNTGEAQNCTSLPENAAWAAATYTPHWNGEEWTGEPEATYYEEEGEECTYECVENFHYEEELCQSDTKPAESCGELPENAAWVEGDGTYIPTWNGKGYPYATAHYADEGDCAYQCVEGYEWNVDTVKCALPVAKVLCTGQTKCYDAGGSIIDCPAEGEEFYGQDASYTARQSCTPQVYEKILEEEDCIEDNDACNIVDDLSTGLRWYLYDKVGEDITWENAYTFCDTLDTGDGREWRLPTAKELMSIINSGSSYPSLRQAYFRTGMYSSNTYWSGTYFRNKKTEQDEVLILDTSHGYLRYDSYGKEGLNYFACVSGEEYGVAGTFTVKNISGGAVVTDSATDLMWKASTELDKSWSQALAYCEELEYAGYSDWRLPNRNEFATLLNYTGKELGDNKSDFPDIIGGNYWTSTFAPDYGGSEGPFIMEVGGGTMFSVGYTQWNVTTAYTLCVRNDDIAEYQAVPVCDESGYTPCEDPETGIVWSQEIIYPESYITDYLEIAQICRESTQGGISQWRIPTIDELRTILDSEVLKLNGGTCVLPDACDQSNSNCYDIGSCNTGTAFESIFHDVTFLISGTLVCGDAENSWKVNLKDGRIEPHSSEAYLEADPSVRCVKDESLPNITFPYTDSENELVWSSRSKDNMTWIETAEYCRDLVEGGSDNWRVPTLEEVETLVESCEGDGCEPNLTGNYSVFAELTTLWSSTVSVETSVALNVLDFMFGSQEGVAEDINSYSDAKVRCVRSTDDPETDPIIDAPYYDEESNLLWSEKSGPLTNHSEAVAYCESLNAMNNGAGYEGLTEWRVPDIAEFASILDCEEGRSTFIRPVNNNQGNPGVSVALGGCNNPAFEGHFPVFGDLGIFASTYLGRTGYHFYADFTTGQVLVAGYEDGSLYGDRKKYVRCVSYPNACEDNPCLEIENSDGTCTSEAGVYSCGCTANALWDGEECVIQE